jgi:hypothetical protein
VRKLTVEEITGLASRTGVRKIAVENFLMTLTNNPSFIAAMENLKQDTRIYKWNKETYSAILDGIIISEC